MNFGFFASYVALWALAVFQGLLMLAVLRQLAELRQLMDQGALPNEDWLPVGSRAPEFAGQDIHSGEFVSSRLFDGRGGVILFLSPLAAACAELLREASSHLRRTIHELSLLSAATENRTLARTLEIA
jgi:hypothetical protein